MRTTLLCTLLVLVCLGAGCMDDGPGAPVPQSPAEPDVLGWQATRWGMSAEEISSAAPDGLTKLPERSVYAHLYVDYVIPGYQLVDEAFTVHFQMADPGDSLVQVLVRLDDFGSPPRQTRLFESLLEGLTRKYGSPLYTRDSRGSEITQLSREWVFPTTTIELSYSYACFGSQVGLATGNLCIRYFPTARGDFPKL